MLPRKKRSIHYKSCAQFVGILSASVLAAGVLQHNDWMVGQCIALALGTLGTLTHRRMVGCASTWGAGTMGDKRVGYISMQLIFIHVFPWQDNFLSPNKQLFSLLGIFSISLVCETSTDGMQCRTA